MENAIPISRWLAFHMYTTGLLMAFVALVVSTVKETKIKVYKNTVYFSDGGMMSELTNFLAASLDFSVLGDVLNIVESIVKTDKLLDLASHQELDFESLVPHLSASKEYAVAHRDAMQLVFETVDVSNIVDFVISMIPPSVVTRILYAAFIEDFLGPETTMKHLLCVNKALESELRQLVSQRDALLVARDRATQDRPTQDRPPDLYKSVLFIQRARIVAMQSDVGSMFDGYGKWSDCIPRFKELIERHVPPDERSAVGSPDEFSTIAPKNTVLHDGLVVTVHTPYIHGDNARMRTWSGISHVPCIKRRLRLRCLKVTETEDVLVQACVDDKTWVCIDVNGAGFKFSVKFRNLVGYLFPPVSIRRAIRRSMT
jgi:hypothetical protein